MWIRKSKTDIAGIISEIMLISMRDLLGNIEDIKDFHKKVILTKLEQAGTDSCLIR